ncbi:MAG TPA: hypothetical protein PKK48_05580, partial [Phycisphaerae bacterium]|nr:hypothetical protein [Phycisphaerae bacterium]
MLLRVDTNKTQTPGRTITPHKKPNKNAISENDVSKSDALPSELQFLIDSWSVLTDSKRHQI